MNRVFPLLAIALLLFSSRGAVGDDAQAVLNKYCADCHSETPEAGLDLANLPRDFSNAHHIKKWIKVFDRVQRSEMPPADAPQPTQQERDRLLQSLQEQITAAEAESTSLQHARLRRLTRSEYENTLRDLFELPGLALANDLPADSASSTFDKQPASLDISHVHLARYLDAADRTLDLAIATRPQPPSVRTRRISLANAGGFVAHVLMNGDGVLLRDGQPDPQFPPAGQQSHLDEGAHEYFGTFRNGSSVGLFRNEDESFSPYFIEHVTIYPGRYRVRTSLWSFQWDRGSILPALETEAARLSVVQLTGDGRGGQHPSYVLGYFNAPPNQPQEHEVIVWLNRNELIGFNTASLAPVVNYSRPGRALAFTGPGIACDWLEIEGPLHESWPPRSHQMLFQDLPIREFTGELAANRQAPRRSTWRQLGHARNRPDPESGIWTVHSSHPQADAERLLQQFLPRLFRRPVSQDVLQQYVQIAISRLEAGDCFETAMRAAYRTALCSPDFLYHIEPLEALDDHAFACRLSYFLWNSLPDDRLRELADQGQLRYPEILAAEIQRLLADPKSQRFIDDFVGQWLKIRQIAANDPDRNLYPEFSPYLQDSMVAETRAYFRELLEQNLDATHLVRSDFIMVNEALAKHYGITGIAGAQVRRIPLPSGCPRGGFLTQAAILKVTANGTTTSPVPRGAFVNERIFGQPPEPPPESVPAIEPDVQGATTIREQLARHREDAACASCHRSIDPPGFALESFDVIGGYRERYRITGPGDSPQRGLIDPAIGLAFSLGAVVDASGELPDGQRFQNIQDLQSHWSTNPEPLLRNLAHQLVIYATGQESLFRERPLVDEIVTRTIRKGGGLQDLLVEVIASPLLTGLPQTLELPRPDQDAIAHSLKSQSQHLLMTATLPERDFLAIPPPDEPTPSWPTSDNPRFEKLTAQVFGLFQPDQADRFRKVVEQIKAVEIEWLDAERAEVGLRYDVNAEWLRDATADQAIERINQPLAYYSNHTMSLRPQSAIPRDQLQRIEFGIQGVHCAGCSLALYQMLVRAEGVEQAQVSFQQGVAALWINPQLIDRPRLLALLRERNIEVTE